jgi:hypothetical protein
MTVLVAPIINLLKSINTLILVYLLTRQGAVLKRKGKIEDLEEGYEITLLNHRAFPEYLRASPCTKYSNNDVC